MGDSYQSQTKVHEQVRKCGESMEGLFSDFRAVLARKQRISLWWSQQVSHFHFDTAFFVNITDVCLEATYDIGVYMVGGTEILMPLFTVNIYQHGKTWKLGLFSLVNVNKITVLSTR